MPRRVKREKSRKASGMREYRPSRKKKEIWRAGAKKSESFNLGPDCRKRLPKLEEEEGG